MFNINSLRTSRGATQPSKQSCKLDSLGYPATWRTHLHVSLGISARGPCAAITGCTPVAGMGRERTELSQGSPLGSSISATPALQSRFSMRCGPPSPTPLLLPELGCTQPCWREEESRPQRSVCTPPVLRNCNTAHAQYVRWMTCTGG